MSVSDRFINGLKKYNLTIEEIQSGLWSYAGGDSGGHYNYWKLIHRATSVKKIPTHQEKCICGHKIVEQCYITNGERFIVLGNCCIKRFIPKELSGRTCSTCHKPHKNRIVNRCNVCRVGVCDICGVLIHRKYKRCYTCFFDK